MKRDKNKIKACFSKKQTLCWKCKKVFGDCSWTKLDEDAREILFQPVDGWVAEKTSLLMYSYDGTPRHVTSYIVKYCPQYEEG